MLYDANWQTDKLYVIMVIDLSAVYFTRNKLKKYLYVTRGIKLF